MRTKIVTAVLAGSLGLTGAALLSPPLASAQTPSPSTGANPVEGGLTALKDALKGLVGDDTLTQAQADRVAATLAERGFHAGRGGSVGRGMRGGRVSPEVTAEAAGATVAELQEARAAGRTLAQLAASNGVPRATLVRRLVEAAEAQLAADVSAGRLTQAQADEAKSTLTARVTERVDRVGGGDGHGGRHGRGGRHDEGTGTPGTGSTPGTATPSPGA